MRLSFINGSEGKTEDWKIERQKEDGKKGREEKKMKEGRKEERKNEKEDREVHSFLLNSIAI